MERTLFEQIAELTKPKEAPLKMYAFTKESGIVTEDTKIETVFATSFDECFIQRPDLVNWFPREIRKNIGL